MTSNPDDRPNIGEVFENQWFEEMTKDMKINTAKYRAKQIQKEPN